MTYSKEAKEQAMSILLNRRTAAKDQAAAHRQQVLQRIPQIKEIENRLYATGFQISRAILQSQDVSQSIAVIQKENQELQRLRGELLMHHGFSHDCLEVKYYCPQCSDTGYYEKGMCDCLKELLRQLAYKKLSEEVELEKYTFSNFSLHYYPHTIQNNNTRSPREVMDGHCRRCVDYANTFSETSSSLLFLGGTGLGKTHLSIAIAGKVVQKGYRLIYSSVQNLLHKLERQRFSRESNTEHYNDYMQMLLDCDLLIMDDLGAEFSTSFTSSTIYNIVNSRLLQGKPTIISSNLDSTKLLEERYSERFVSRLIGNYTVLKFQGEDIRILKKTNM